MMPGSPSSEWYALILSPLGAVVSRRHVEHRRLVQRRVDADHVDRVTEALVGVGTAVVAEREEVEGLRRRAGVVRMSNFVTWNQSVADAARRAEGEPRGGAEPGDEDARHDDGRAEEPEAADGAGRGGHCVPAVVVGPAATVVGVPGAVGGGAVVGVCSATGRPEPLRSMSRSQPVIFQTPAASGVNSS